MKINSVFIFTFVIGICYARNDEMNSLYRYLHDILHNSKISGKCEGKLNGNTEFNTNYKENVINVYNNFITQPGQKSIETVYEDSTDICSNNENCVYVCKLQPKQDQKISTPYKDLIENQNQMKHTSYGSSRATQNCAPSITKAWGPYLQQITKPFDHAEEPTWDPEKQLLYFVDIHEGLVLSFNPKNRAINQVKLDGDVTPVIPTRIPNRFIVGLNKTLVLLSWDGKTDGQHNITEITSVDADKNGNRFNDGKADPKGRLWIGTMGYENASGVIPDQASLYQFARVGATTNKPYNKVVPQYPINVTVTKEISPVSISNGLAWSKNLSKFYYIDTPTRQVWSYDFDVDKGAISNKKVAFDLENYEIAGNPDGMTIDAEDNLFVALFGGGAVIKVNPTSGELLQRIAIPATQVTSCMFGGRALDILFVTTSKHGLTPEQLGYQPAAGSVFAITNLGVVGRKMFPANY